MHYDFIGATVLDFLVSLLKGQNTIFIIVGYEVTKKNNGTCGSSGWYFFLGIECTCPLRLFILSPFFLSFVTKPGFHVGSESGSGSESLPPLPTIRTVARLLLQMARGNRTGWWMLTLNMVEPPFATRTVRMLWSLGGHYQWRTCSIDF